MPPNPPARAQVQRDLKSLPRCLPTPQSSLLPLEAGAGGCPAGGACARGRAVPVARWCTVLENSWPCLRPASGCLEKAAGAQEWRTSSLKGWSRAGS